MCFDSRYRLEPSAANHTTRDSAIIKNRQTFGKRTGLQMSWEQYDTLLFVQCTVNEAFVKYTGRRNAAALPQRKNSTQYSSLLRYRIE